MHNEDIEYLILADDEIEKGDYVTLSRRFRGDFVEESLITFSDVKIQRVQYADYAKTFQKSSPAT